MKVFDIELIVAYDIGANEIIEISQGTLPTDTFNFHILDKDREKSTGRTTIRFENINDLRKCLNDFEKRFNLIKKK